eukprot:CAMPEP_0197660922 /NCGR_PEP_ID=MMETSP1338-20131121/51145_1 /TAXON_ID=43686 ORGANISM="Pelagodinium beii, Strain RCC1491" /NCGR_SAMPLE_ID=MMETSP1338 /ASSEMBLY_ACC=CAM_ASM_000754 /LENGTH=298 /DNA_ID=CAMNT_0043238379 /DNA_START=46 /DNA_END=942 /DNA_ORIENTATION=+
MELGYPAYGWQGDYAYTELEGAGYHYYGQQAAVESSGSKMNPHAAPFEFTAIPAEPNGFQFNANAPIFQLPEHRQAPQSQVTLLSSSPPPGTAECRPVMQLPGVARRPVPPSLTMLSDTSSNPATPSSILSSSPPPASMQGLLPAGLLSPVTPLPVPDLPTPAAIAALNFIRRNSALLPCDEPQSALAGLQPNKDPIYLKSPPSTATTETTSTIRSRASSSQVSVMESPVLSAASSPFFSTPGVQVLPAIDVGPPPGMAAFDRRAPGSSLAALMSATQPAWGASLAQGIPPLLPKAAS